MTTLAKQFQDFAECCLGLARSAETAARRERFIQMAHEYRLASFLIQDGWQTLRNEATTGEAIEKCRAFGRGAAAEM
jgi:hypothetical protein